MCLASVYTAVSLDEQHWVEVGRCRVACVEDLLTEIPAQDSDCLEDEQCDMCWRMCEYVSDTYTWDYLCKPESSDVCPQGCQTACTYVQSEKDHTAKTKQANFHYKPRTFILSTTELIVDWKPVSLEDEAVLLYSLFWKSEEHAQWNFVVSTVASEAIVTGPHGNFPGLTFRLLAVGRKGVIAQSRRFKITKGADSSHDDRPSYDDISTTAILPTFDASISMTSATTESHDVTGLNTVITNTPSTDSTTTFGTPLGITVRVMTSSEPQGLSGLVTVKQTGLNAVIMNWGHVRCERLVNGIKQACDLDEEQSTGPEINGDDEDDTLYFNLPQLTYNSWYWVEVTSDGQRLGEQYTFITPLCAATDHTMTRCLDNEAYVTDNSAFWHYVTLGVCGVICIVLVIVGVILRRDQGLQKRIISSVSVLRMHTKKAWKVLMKGYTRNNTESRRNQTTQMMGRTDLSSLRDVVPKSIITRKPTYQMVTTHDNEFIDQLANQMSVYTPSVSSQDFAFPSLGLTVNSLQLSDCSTGSSSDTTSGLLFTSADVSNTIRYQMRSCGGSTAQSTVLSDSSYSMA